MKASDLFVKALENEGIEYIFGVPGEENLDVLESLRKSSIKLVVTRHEQAAGFMAATIGRLTGKPGVCLSTLGPGATNFVTAAAYAKLGAMPMMMITGQKPIKSSKQGAFQIIDTVTMMRPLTQYSKVIVNGNQIPSMMREAFRIAERERPGPVHLELPEDIASEETNASLVSKSSLRRPVAEEKALTRAITLIESAKNPLILVGAGANRKITHKMLTRLIEETGIPFVNTQMGKGVVDERHPLYLGTAALSSNDFVHCAIDKADLIINVGHDVIEKPPFIMHDDGAKVIHVNFFPAQIDEVYFPQSEILGDVGNTIWQLVDRVKKQDHWDFSSFMSIKKKLDAHLHELDNDESSPLKPQRIVADVRKAMPSDGILCLDNGMYKLWFARHYPAHQPNTILLDNALATMGAGLPSAIAAKLVKPGRQVMAIVGDGGFMMNSQELETAVRLKLDLVILVINDSAYGMIKWKQQGMGFEDFGLDYGNPDFVAYAKSYGANGHRVEAAGQLVTLIEHAQMNGGVHLIEVPIDYSENKKVFTDELKKITCES
jgi:acetolactate synthase I/II/III large subunit